MELTCLSMDDGCFENIKTSNTHIDMNVKIL